MEVAEREPAGFPAEEDRLAPSPRSGPGVPALVLGLVALICAAVLPFAPVAMSAPVVSWPQQPSRPQSTMLELTNEKPLGIDVRFSCAAARAAATTEDGVLLSTIVPGEPAATQSGLLVQVTAGELTVLDRGRTAIREPVPSGGCEYHVVVGSDQLSVDRDGARVATLTVPDGAAAVTDAAPAVLPDVDVLATSVRSLPGAGDLHVTIRVDDQFNTTPGPVKKVLIAVLLLAAFGSLGALLVLDRRQRAPTPARERLRLRVRLADPRFLVDVAVVLALLLWWFLAPETDDDGYYAAMARNSSVEGFVGNYYQLLNQSFTPFTWFYRVLGWWESVGDSRVLLRVPALVVGLVTWVLIRRIAGRAGSLPTTIGGRRWPAFGVTVLLGVAYMAWWLPYAMGVRPEAVVAMLAAASLACVSWALRRRRLFPIGLGLALAGLAIGCHPTGLVALAPFLATIRRLGPLVWRGGGRQGVTRLVLVLAPAALAVAAPFADGTINDFIRGQQIFLSIAPQNHWYDEYQRWFFLLSPGAMGSYAKRAAVLLAVTALLWFAVLAVTARARGLRLPPVLVLSGQSLALAFLLLWFSPSKWTHHFGALAGIGALFLALAIGSAPTLVRQVTAGRRLAWSVPVAVLLSGIATFALAYQGLNSWAYNWLPAMPHANVPPYISVVALDSPFVWLVVVLVVIGAVALWRRRGAGRRGPAWLVAVPLLALLFLGSSVVYLLGSFGYETLRTLHGGYSLGAAAVTDPLSRNCDAAGALHVFDVDAARPLPVAPTAPAATSSPTFVSGGGYFPADPPPSPVGTGVARSLWGSFAGGGTEDRTGDMSTPWYTLPATSATEGTAVLAAGRLSLGNSLTVEYARANAGGQPRVVDSQPLQDTLDGPTWRTLLLDTSGARAAGATVLRLVARDHSGGIGGWLAFTGPSVLPAVPLQQVVPRQAPVALSWQVAFLFPCQRQPQVRFGITEPARYGVTWVDDPATSGVNDSVWRLDRGGLFGPVLRTSSMTQLAGYVAGAPGLQAVQAEKFVVPYAVGKYDLDPTREARWGWQGPRS